MAKTAHPDRHTREKSGRGDGLAETTLSVDRVTRVVKGGRRLRFRAIVVVGDRKGKVGLGTGKANEVQVAVQKAMREARKMMVQVPLQKGTIPHEVDVKYKAARIRLIPACEGTGIIAGGALRIILEHAGVKNVLGKRFGTSNKLVNAQAAICALQMFRGGRGQEGDVPQSGEDTVMAEEEVRSGVLPVVTERDEKSKEA